MGYQISYASGGIRKKTLVQEKKTTTKRVRFVCVILALLACLLLLRLEVVQQILLPGDPIITRKALDNFIIAIGNGVDLGDAVTAFCQEIILSA